MRNQTKSFRLLLIIKKKKKVILFKMRKKEMKQINKIMMNKNNGYTIVLNKISQNLQMNQ